MLAQVIKAKPELVRQDLAVQPSAALAYRVASRLAQADQVAYTSVQLVSLWLP